MKLRLVIFLFNLLAFTSVFGQTFDSFHVLPDDSFIIRKIVSNNNMSIKAITVNNVSLTIGNTFLGKHKIHWHEYENVDYIEVRNERTREILKFSRLEFSPEVTNLYSAYIKKPRTGTKGMNKAEAVKDMKGWLSKPFYMTGDYLFIGSSLIIDNEHTFVLEPLNVPDSKPLRLKYNSSEPYVMFVSKESLKAINAYSGNKKCAFRVKYIGDGETIFITDKFTIVNY